MGLKILKMGMELAFCGADNGNGAYYVALIHG